MLQVPLQEDEQISKMLIHGAAELCNSNYCRPLTNLVAAEITEHHSSNITHPAAPNREVLLLVVVAASSAWLRRCASFGASTTSSTRRA